MRSVWRRRGAVVAVEMTPPEVSATAKPGNYATTLYIARAVQAVAEGRSLSVLDMGCGDGRVMRFFDGLGHTLSGFDLPDREAALNEQMAPLLGDQFGHRIRIMRDERRIPFEDGIFDVVYANQVFEHVRFLDQMVSEVTRVLRPGGTLIALFPLATYPLEGHSLIPFAHWLPPGRARQRYFTAMLACRIGRRFPGMGARASAAEWDARLRDYTFYRFLTEIQGLLDHYFAATAIDTGGYVRAKLDLLAASPRVIGRAAATMVAPLHGRMLDAAVTHGFMGVFRATAPRPVEERQRLLAWKT